MELSGQLHAPILHNIKAYLNMSNAQSYGEVDCDISAVYRLKT
jgi:hypothetical protein